MDRISLNNSAFEGNNNAYVLQDRDDIALIDTGDATERTAATLENALATRSLSYGDIDFIFLTHWHGDHAGLAGRIQEAGDATVYAHEHDADLIRGTPSAWDAMETAHAAAYERWGLPGEKRDVLDSILHGERFGTPPTVEPFTDGETFTVGDQEVTVRHLPGHTAGLSGFERRIDGDRQIAAGDALLPVYTPNVGGADVRVDRPLATYLETLGTFVEADFAVTFPGHRDPITAPGPRAAQIIEHHERRAWRVLEVLSDTGPADAWTVSSELFGALEDIHILHGPGEAAAHLDHLADAGDIDRIGTEYNILDATRTQMNAREDQRWPLLA